MKKKTLTVALMAFGLLGAGMMTYAKSRQETYRSSIQVTEQDAATGERDDGEDADSLEAARLSSQAKINLCSATEAALASVPGSALRSSLDNENGNLVYGIEVKDANGKVKEVTIDAGTAAVLRVDDVDSDTEDRED